MEGISKRYLNEMLLKAKDHHDDSDTDLLEYIISKCKELPAPQWQTIDEFKANPIVGWCYVNIPATESIVMRHYRDNNFFDDEDDSVPMADYFITHVMPIKTPDAPK